MSQTEIDAAKVASKMQELAEVLEEDLADINVEVLTDFGTKTLNGKAVQERIENTSEAGDDDEDTSEAGDEQSPTETEDTLEEGEVACQCGAVFDSKAGLNGHLAHCDSQSKTEEDSEEDEDTIEDGDEDSISDAELVEMGVKESNIEDVRKYRSKNGVCQTEDCPYGANDGEDHCASHQSSTGGDDSNNSSSKKTKSYEDLTEGQKAAARDLIEDEDYSLEKAVNMV